MSGQLSTEQSFGLRDHAEFQTDLPVSEAFSIREREIHLWTVRLIASESSVRALYRTCSADEKRRAASFHFEKDRKLFVIARGVLRSILGRYLGKLSEHVKFEYGTKGKPVLEAYRLPALHFNLAHSEECVLYAITQEAELGVDVERVRKLSDAEAIAEHFFSPGECEDLHSLDPGQRTEGFFNCWTRKEAYVKALGEGLSTPLDGFQVSLKPGQPAAFLKLDDNLCRASRWSLRHLILAGDYIGALAIPAMDCSLVERKFADVDECLKSLHRDERLDKARYGIFVPAQRYALKFMRYMHEHGIGREAMRAIAMASYHHAQSNPRAVMHGRPLTEEMYDASRWIAEPYRLFDCCQENDGAAALILVAAERAKDFRHKPAYVLAVAQGSDHRNAARSFNAPDFASSSFGPVAPHLWEMAKLGPEDVDVLQSYENFTGGVLMSMVEHGFFEPEQANEFLTLDNLLVPAGKLPLNTSGGNLAECYMHGLELQIEAVRQIRGQSTAQVPDAHVGCVIAGPMVTPVSTMIVGSQETL